MGVSRNGSTKVFAERLRLYLQQKGWNRQDLASRMNVTATTVGNWERGKGFPEIGSRERLCQLLGVRAEDLHLPPYNDGDWE